MKNEDRNHPQVSTPAAALAAWRKTRQAQVAEGAPPIRFDPIAKAKDNPKSLRLAVSGKCWDCVGAGQDPNPREQIRECPSKRCPLWAVRPYQRVEKSQ